MESTAIGAIHNDTRPKLFNIFVDNFTSHGKMVLKNLVAAMFKGQLSIMFAAKNVAGYLFGITKTHANTVN